MSNPYLKTLSEAVTAMHDCECRHLETVRVHEMVEDETAFSGDVEIFELIEHPQTKRAFAWGWEADDGDIQTIAILNVSPIVSPREAVQAAIVSGNFKPNIL